MSYETVLNGKISGGSGSSSSGLYSIEEACQNLWMIDYKTNGQKSHVYNRKAVWKELMESPLAINDLDISDTAINFAINEGGHIGKIFGNIEGMANADWEVCSTIEDVILTPSTLDASLNHSMTRPTILTKIKNSDNLMKSINENTTLIETLIANTYMNSKLVNGTSGCSSICLFIDATCNVTSNTCAHSETPSTRYYKGFARSGLSYVNIDGKTITLVTPESATGNTLIKKNYNYETIGTENTGTVEQPYSSSSHTLNQIVRSVTFSGCSVKYCDSCNKYQSVNTNGSYIPL